MDTATSSEALIAARNVCQIYSKPAAGKLVVLDDVNVTLQRNEIVGLLGRSGSGKSTLLRAIAGLIKPTSGTITCEGHDLAGPSPAIAVVFQTFALFPWLTVLQNVELGLEARGIAPAERRKRALGAIDLIGLDGFESAYPKELSGGMRQRVGLARALVVHPKVLLMDEPFSALDVLTAETLRTDLLDLWCEGRMPIESILMVTHNIEEAVLMCDRILIFGSNPGRIVAEIHVDLPQPRNRLDPAFRDQVEKVYVRMTAREGIARQEGIFRGTGIALILPRVSTNVMSGLIEAVAAKPYDGAPTCHRWLQTCSTRSMIFFRWPRPCNFCVWPTLQAAISSSPRRASVSPTAASMTANAFSHSSFQPMCRSPPISTGFSRKGRAIPHRRDASATSSKII
jgi:NitT/TauT family transport system ATP-binding protein